MEAALFDVRLDTLFMILGLNACHVKVQIVRSVVLVQISNVQSVMMGGINITSNACSNVLKVISKTMRIKDVIDV